MTVETVRTHFGLDKAVSSCFESSQNATSTHVEVFHSLRNLHHLAPIVDCMDCRDVADEVRRGGGDDGKPCLPLYSAVFILPSYRYRPKQRYRLLVVHRYLPSFSTSSQSSIVNIKCSCLYSYAQNLRVPILSGILNQELDGIGSFGLPSHPAKYVFVSGS